MPRSKPVQVNFTGGELDPLLLGRPDIDQYGGGAEILENVEVLPQGGVTRRPGTKFIAILPEATANFRVASFEFSLTQSYVLIMTALKMTIVNTVTDTVEQIIDDGSFLYDDAELTALYWDQTADTMIIVHPDHAPRRLLRDTTKAAGLQFGIDLVPLAGTPIHDFGDTKSPANADERQTIQFAGTWTSSDHFQVGLNGVLSSRIVYNSDTTILAQRIQDALTEHVLVFTGGPGTREVPGPPPPELTVTYVGGSGIPGDFLVKFQGKSGGKNWDDLTFKIDSDADGSASIGRLQGTEGGSGEEVVWGDTYSDGSGTGRGWPSTVLFHEGRLFFGGSRSRPITLWASKAGQFFNFEVGSAQDDDAIDVTLNINEAEAIQHMHSSRHLQVFTSSGEFYVPESPITPTNIVLPKQTDVGITSGVKVRPATLDGATLFVDRAGKGVHQFQFGFAEEAYNTDEISLVSQHLIRSPVAMAVQRKRRGNYAYVVNSDGTMAVLALHRAQSVAGWSRWVTRGDYQDVVTSARRAYVVVQRDLAGVGAVRFLEKLDEAFYTDAGKQVVGNQSEIFTGFSHLSGETVQVRVDDETALGTTTVNGATIQTNSPADLAEAGLGFNTHIRPMPPAPQFQDGVGLFRMRRPVRYWLQLQDSADVHVNGYRLGDRTIGGAALDDPPPLLSGPFNLRLRGWSRAPRVDITQTLPMPMTLLAIGYDALESS